MILNKMHQQLMAKKSAVDDWMQVRLFSLEAPIYSSADIRHAGYKMAVVDTNLFPAGFNNLCETFSKRAGEVLKNTLSRLGLVQPTVLILPEAHTRNEFYWNNIVALQEIIGRAGAESVIGSYEEIGIDLPSQVQGLDNVVLKVLPVERRENEIFVGSLKPDLVLLNNDFSHRFPEELCGIEQPVMPSPALGWHQRQKSDHFDIYEELMGEFAEVLEMDPWFLNPLMTTAREIDIHEETSRGQLRDAVDSLIAQIRSKHEQHGISAEPYVFIKDNSGTYGMGITHVTSGQQVLELGRRKRNKMAAGKGRPEVSDFIIQEGLETVQSYEGMPLEPVFYLIDGKPIGNFFRIHGDKTPRDNLNSKGMSFNCLCSHQIESPSGVVDINCDSMDELRTVGGVLAQIATYAASLELVDIKKKLVEPGTAVKGCL